MSDDRWELLCLDLPGAEAIRHHLDATLTADMAAIRACLDGVSEPMAQRTL